MPDTTALTGTQEHSATPGGISAHDRPDDAPATVSVPPDTGTDQTVPAHATSPALPQPGSQSTTAGSRAPSTAGAQPLAGVRVLLGRERTHDSFATALEADGAEVTRCALTTTVPGDASALAATREALLTGHFDWLIVTSARTLRFLDVSGLPGFVRTAAVGPATACALHRATGRAPDVTGAADAESLLALLTPPDSRLHPGQPAHPPVPVTGAGASARSVPSRFLPRQGLPSTTLDVGDDNRLATDAAYLLPGQRVLLPASAISRPVLAEGLAGLGAEVTRLDAYSTVSAAPDTVPSQIRRTWADGSYDVVILTAASAVRAAAALLGPLPDGGVVVLGEPSARAVRETGWLGTDERRLAVAASPDAAGVAAAVRGLVTARSATPPHRQASTPSLPSGRPAIRQVPIGQLEQPQHPRR